MLDTQKKLYKAKSEQDRKHCQQGAGILDKQIDALVYELYDLTPREIVASGRDELISLMDIEVEKVLLLLSGFISLKIYDLLIPNERPSFSKYFIEIVFYSVIHFLLFYKVIEFINEAEWHNAFQYLSFVLIFIIVPIFYPYSFSSHYEFLIYAKVFCPSNSKALGLCIWQKRTVLDDCPPKGRN